MNVVAKLVRKVRNMSSKPGKMATPVSHKSKYSIVVLGRGGVGKSALILRFLYDEFIEDYEPTKADCYLKKMVLKTHGEVVLEVLDTAGEEIYPSLRENYLRSADGFLLVFSISDRDSLYSLKEFNDEILRVRGDETKVPCVVVATKSDLVEERKVSMEEIEAITTMWDIPFIETSARTKHNVEEVFIEVTQQMKFQKTVDGSTTLTGNEMVLAVPSLNQSNTSKTKSKSKWRRTWQIFQTSVKRKGKWIKVSLVRSTERLRKLITKKKKSESATEGT